MLESGLNRVKGLVTHGRQKEKGSPVGVVEVKHLIKCLEDRALA